MKKLFFSLLITILLQLNVFAQSGWNLIYNFEQGITNIAFKDSLTGLASGAVNAKIYRTVDGGISWRVVNITGLSDVISNIIFYNDNICFGVGKNGTVIKSVDNGNTWSVGSVGDRSELRTIYATPGGTLFICQRSGNDIYKSSDQGGSWTKIFSNSTGYVYDFGFINEKIGYLVGDSMVKTTDGGDNWFMINDIIPLARNLRIKFVTENIGYRLAGNYSGGKVVKTTDGGNNWFILYDSNYGPNIVDFTISGTNTIWAVGYHNILNSRNAGSSWAHQSFTPLADLYKTTSINSLTCFVLNSSGGLYKTVDGGLSRPSLVSPNNNSIDLPLTTALSWSSFTSGNPFKLQIAADAVLGNLVLDTMIFGTTKEIRSLNLNSIYYWRVQEKFGDFYSPWSEVWNFKTTAGTPVLSSPSNNSIDVPLATTFMWTDVTLNADTYQLQVSAEPSFVSPFFNDSTISINNFDLSSLYDDVLYYWRVRAKINNIYGEWSSVWQFRTLAKTARLLSPINNSTISPINITLQWSPTAQTSNYRLQVSTDSLFATNVIDQDNIVGLSAVINVSYGTKYFWHVGAKNEDGNTYWSDNLRFQTRPLPTTSFPLELGNKWYYKAGSTRDYYYYGVEKEITDTLSNGFKKVTVKYFYQDSISVSTELWAYKDGKFYINDFSTVYYNDYITHDTCSSTGMVEICWHLIPYQIFEITDTAQVYSNWIRMHGVAADEVTIFPEIGIVKDWHYSYFTSATRDSIYLVGFYRNGEVLGDTTLSPPPVYQGDDWVMQNSGSTNDLNAVSFTDRYTGTAVGKNGTILRTTNSGTTWYSQSSGTTENLNDISFIGANDGIAVGNSGVILKTTDGGSNWVPQVSGGSSSIYNLYRIDGSIAIAIGDGVIIKTTTGGATWWNVFTLGSGGDPKKRGISFSDRNNGLIVAGSGAVLTTTDGGTTWRFGQYNFEFDFYDVFFLDENNCSIVGFNASLNTGLIMSRYGAPQPSGTNQALLSVSYTDSTHGIAVGNNGIIVRTTNGGANWLKQPSGTTNSLNDVTFTDAKNGWIVGAGGLILHTTSITEIVSQSSFPLELGNKWYYQAGSNRNEVYGIVKEVTDTLSNGFREITSKSFSRTGVTTGKEYWGFIDGKFYANSYSPAIDYYAQVYYNNFLTHDSCIYIGGTTMDNDCWKLTEYPMFNIIDSAQIYTRSGAIASIVSFQQTVIVSPKIGIIRTWFSSYPRQGVGDRDSTYLIGMFRNGEFLGDTVFSNPYRAANLISPLNGSHDMFLTVSLQWRKPSEALSYRVQVSTDTTFSNLIGDYSGLTDTLKIVGPLKDFTDYYWRVGTLSSDGKVYWSSYFNFRTMNTKNIPYLLSPEDGASIPQLSTFKWRKAEEGVSYRLQISTDPFFYNLAYDRWGLTDTTKTIDSLDLETEYFWRVEATTISGHYLSQVFSFTVAHFPDPYRAVKLISPLNGSLDLFPTVSLKWNKVSEATSYNLLVSKDINFRNIVLNYSGLTDTSKFVGPLENFTKYYWRIGTIWSDGSEYWSSASNFTTIDQKYLTNLQVPSNRTSEIPQFFTFKWNKVANAVSYRLQISTDSLCTNAVYDYGNLLDTLKVVDLLDSKTQYFWRVETSTLDYRATSRKYWTMAYTFSTIAAPEEFMLHQNYPNPFNPSTTISYEIPKAGFVSLKLYDVLGREVATLVNEEKIAAKYDIEFKANILASGVYFYQLRAGDFVQTKKMVLLR